MNEWAILAVALWLFFVDGFLYALDGARKRQIEELRAIFYKLADRVDDLDQTADRNRRWGRR